MALDPIEVMAAWAEQTTEQQGKMIDLFVAFAVLQQGEYETFEVEITPTNLAETARDFDVIRKVEGNTWIIRVSPKPK